MKIKILWVRHCESCSNVVIHSKYKTRWVTDTKQGFVIPPNCTIIGLIQSYMFGYHILPEILKRFSKYKKVDFYCSLLKRTMITSKFITYGLKESKFKIKASENIQRLCNISERRSLFEKMFRNEFNRVSLKTSDKFVKDVNKTHKKGKKITKKIKKKTQNCNTNDHEVFKNETLPLLNSKSLNVIVSHGVILRKIFNLKGLKNVDAVLVEYDTDKNTHKVIDKIKNISDMSDDTNSHKRIKENQFDFHYKGNNIDKKVSTNLHEFSKKIEYINLSDKNNEITCE